MSGHRRDFVTIGERQVHCRWAGAGPPVALLHACPKSSLEQAPLVERLSRRFTAFAFDIPGYGDSDPLPLAQPEIADFADAFAETLDAMKIGRFAAYGRHTGGLILLEFGRRHPGRITRMVLDGFPMFTDAERRRFLSGYLEPLLPRWDGLHLPGLWSRLRENHLFFPWNEGPDPERRNNLDMPPAEQLHATAVDLLKVMDLWRVGYASAFRYRPEEALRATDTPTLVMARRDDLLFPHLERLPAPPASVSVEPHSYDVEAWADRLEDFLSADSSPVRAGPPPPAAPRAAQPWSRIVSCPGGRIRLREAGDGPRDLLLLHDLPGASALETALARAVGETARVVAPDLPGVGLSPAPGHGSGTGDLAARILDVANRELRPGFAIAARGLSARLALDMARLRDRPAPLCLIRPLFAPLRDAKSFARRHAPPVAADPSGAHLLQLWRIARDGELYYPWFTPVRAAIRGSERRLDAGYLTAKVCAMAENLEGYRWLVTNSLSASPPAAPPAGEPRLVLHDPDPVGRTHAGKAAANPEALRPIGPTTGCEAVEIRAWLARLAARRA